jgi:hypothetical protein
VPGTGGVVSLLLITKPDPFPPTNLPFLISPHFLWLFLDTVCFGFYVFGTLLGRNHKNRERRYMKFLAQSASASFAKAFTIALITVSLSACFGGSGGGSGNKSVGGDKTAPVLAEVIPVTSPTEDTTPNYTFSSTEAGTISYGGSCSSVTASAVAGNNTVTFNALALGAYSNCQITVTDAAGNTSAPLSISVFTVADLTAPTLAM